MKTLIWTSDLIKDGQKEEGIFDCGINCFLIQGVQLFSYICSHLCIKYYNSHTANKQWHIFQSSVKLFHVYVLGSINNVSRKYT